MDTPTDTQSTADGEAVSRSGELGGAEDREARVQKQLARLLRRVALGVAHALHVREMTVTEAAEACGMTADRMRLIVCGEDETVTLRTLAEVKIGLGAEIVLVLVKDTEASAA